MNFSFMGWICYSRVWISHEGRIVLLFIQRCILWCRVNLSMRNVAGCLFAGQLTTRDAGPHLQVQWKGKSGKKKTNHQWNQKSRKMSQLKTNTGELCVIFQLGTQNRLQRGEFEWECAENFLKTFWKSAFKSWTRWTKTNGQDRNQN